MVFDLHVTGSCMLGTNLGASESGYFQIRFFGALIFRFREGL